MFGSGDVVVLEKRWGWGRHLTACRVSYTTEVVVDGGAMGFGFLATVGCYECCDVAVLSVATGKPASTETSGLGSSEVGPSHQKEVNRVRSRSMAQLSLMLCCCSMTLDTV
ncbi:hypothetical protein F0562_003406 [Nyssa sinensis]|uniref:Uncharacterized protein n=1 Tax=Nyssa sinensis TaxID=561372 RepID=A0A5J5BZ95_9ASTE|nr:hypothetical protein F0562_003406 [Nyssa sinensis]